MKTTPADILTAVLIVAIIFVLVRPRSRAAEAVRAFSDAMAALVRTVTDM